MKFENVKVFNFEGALRGMRNPKESWHLSDSEFGLVHLTEDCGQAIALEWARATDRTQTANFVTEEDLVQDWQLWLWKNGFININKDESIAEVAFIGPKDMKLAHTLITSGPEHRKFLRQIFVSVDITAPLYWWKEFDTYKVATVANSTSTMHKLAETPITMDCFELDNLDVITEKTDNPLYYIDENNEEHYVTSLEADFVYKEDVETIIEICEKLRQDFLNTQDQRYWKMLVQMLPNAWLQKRTVTMNYETLLAICSKGQRRFHKLTEWSGTGEEDSFIQFAHRLPYAQDFIFSDESSVLDVIN